MISITANMDLSNATIEFDLGGAFLANGADWYTTESTYPTLNWRQLGNERITNGGNTITLENVNLNGGEWLTIELDDKIMPLAGNYEIEVTVNDNPSQTAILTILPAID